MNPSGKGFCDPTYSGAARSASYAVCIPLFGDLGGWLGMDAGKSLSMSYMYGLSQSWLSAHAF
jgi:hypothetical protein